jgi:predicted CXXCH cytochrome family protein
MLSQPQMIPEWIKQKRIDKNQIPNPHWNKNDCSVCHKSIPQGKRLNLVTDDIEQLCSYCHSGEFDHSYIHPSGIPIGRLEISRIPEEFLGSMENHKLVTCKTCHDIKAQCLTERFSEKSVNSLFIRNGPYRLRTELCYKCHDESAYQRKNAHDQIDDNGRIREYSCLVCHETDKGLNAAKDIKDVTFHVKDNLIRICRSCHELVAHPSSNFTFTKKGVPNHLVVPSKAMKTVMAKSEKKEQVVLPLDPLTGKIFCATCHNPHERGVIKNPAGAKGADEKQRLRTRNICTNCHDK